MDEQELKYMSLCPTNLAALLVGGMTIHKFSARLKKSSNVKNLDLDYIFIVKVNGISKINATIIIIKYCDCDNFVELHKP